MPVFGMYGKIDERYLKNGREFGVAIGVEIKMAVDEGKMTEDEVRRCVNALILYLNDEGIEVIA